MGRVSVIIPGRNEIYFQQTIDSILERATGDVEVVAVIDGYKPDPPLYAKDNRVKLIHLDKAIGQRAAYNLGVRESTGKYVMKIDAHALLSRGFDEVLKSNCPPKTTVLPEMRRLDVSKWKDKKRGKTHFMYFGIDVFCHYWRAYGKREEAKVEFPEVLTGQGSCWFTTREWNDYIGLLDESLGSWGKVGIEVSLKTWLCGGRQIVNKKAWQAHWFRAGEGRFPYPLSGRQIGRARDFTWNNFFFKESGAFPNQVRPFRWLMKKFAPVPSWETYLVDEYKSNRVILYYTDSQLDKSLAHAVRRRLGKIAGPIPIISVSQEPLNFGKNICVGRKPKIEQSMYEQILAGLEVIPDDAIVYLCEHDVFYHPSHFAYIPKTDKAVYFNKNRYYWHISQNSFLPATGKRALSQAVAYKSYLIAHVKKRLSEWGAFKVRWFTWTSERPNVDVRHGDNLTKNGKIKRLYIKGKTKGVFNLAGWGGVKHFKSVVQYKGMMRHDIIQYLINLYGYRSYLEIGVDKKGTFKHIICDRKDGVDPVRGGNYRMTSDEFFLTNSNTYDIIFIDGLHEAEQVERDINNALKTINDGGVIVMHDCNPRNREEQEVPQRKGLRIWTGDCWKAFVKFRARPDLEMYVVDTNNGCGVIRYGEQNPIIIENLTYDEFVKNKKRWLNLIPPDRFKQYEQARKERYDSAQMQKLSMVG